MMTAVKKYRLYKKNRVLGVRGLCGRRGQSLVEFILMAPFLMALIMWTEDIFLTLLLANAEQKMARMHIFRSMGNRPAPVVIYHEALKGGISSIGDAFSSGKAFKMDNSPMAHVQSADPPYQRYINFKNPFFLPIRTALGFCYSHGASYPLCRPPTYDPSDKNNISKFQK